MTNYHDVAERWVDRGLGRTDRKPLSARQNRMYSDHRDRIFSYGSHFEMGRFITAKDGSKSILLNGDTYSPTTSGHQSYVRSAAHRSGLPVVIIPHRALNNAGIDADTFEIIEVSEDRNVTTLHEFFEMQPGWHWRDDPVGAYVDLTDAEVEIKTDKRHAEMIDDWEHRQAWALRDKEAGRRSAWESYLDDSTRPERPTRANFHCGELREWRTIRHDRNLYTSGRGYQRIDVEELDDGRTCYSWTTSRHLLGGSLIRAQVAWDTTRRCKTCRGVTGAPVEERCTTCWGRGRVRVTGRRWAYFLSDFDHNETHELYFFCELPRGVKPTSMEDAIESLKPTTVNLAEQMGRTVRRQGDIFAISLETVNRRTLRRSGAQFEKMGELLGTNHRATEVARLPNGQTLARGTLWHKPEWRRPDHRRVGLGKAWHVIVKNTVPVAV